MPKAIVRALDRVALWHSAAEETWEQSLGGEAPSEPPTSTPPAGETPKPSVVPKSNKFLGPAKQLKNVLDPEWMQPQGQGYGPHEHPEVANFFQNYPSFTKTYMKPQYQDAFKEHLGEDNYAKLLHHMPEEHHQALTTHQQSPAPKSNKFTGPANQLKKLLEDPHTETSHVVDWLQGSGAGFAKTYLKPNYDDALKSHLGEKNYAELQQHLSPQAQQQQEQAQPKSHYEKMLDTAHNGFFEDEDQHYLDTLHSPEFKQWSENLPEDIQVEHAKWPDVAVHAFENGDYQYPQHDESEPYDLGYGDEAYSEAEPQGLGDKFKAILPPNLADNKHFIQQWNNDPDDPESFAELKQNLPDLAPQLQQIYDEHHGQSDADHINAIQDLLQPVHQQQQPVSNELMQGIQKIFPNHEMDPFASPEQVKQQLESWLKYLPEHEGYAQHVPQLQTLYDQHFGGEAQQASQPDHTFDPWSSTYDEGTGNWQHNEDSLPPGFKHWAEDQGVPLSEYNPDEVLNALSAGWKNMSPEEKQQHASQELDNFFDDNFGKAPAEKNPGFQQWMQDEYGLNPAQIQDIADKSGPGGKYEHAGGIQAYLDDFNEATGHDLQWQPLRNEQSGQQSTDSYSHDLHQIGTEIAAADPGGFSSNYAYDFAKKTPEEAKEILQSLINDGQKGYFPAEETAKYQQIFDKYFGTDSPTGGGIDINTTKPDQAGLEKVFDHLWPNLSSEKESWVEHMLKPETQWNADYFKEKYPHGWAKAEQDLAQGGVQQSGFVPNLHGISQQAFKNEVPMPLLDGGYHAKAPYKWAPGAQAFLAEHGITTPEDVKYGKLEQLYNTWDQLDDADKQKYIDMEQGGGQPQQGDKPSFVLGHDTLTKDQLTALGIPEDDMASMVGASPIVIAQNVEYLTNNPEKQEKYPSWAKVINWLNGAQQGVTPQQGPPSPYISGQSSPADMGLTVDKLKELGFDDNLASQIAHWDAEGLASNMKAIEKNGGSDYAAGNEWANLYDYLTGSGQSPAGGQSLADAVKDAYSHFSSGSQNAMVNWATHDLPKLKSLLDQHADPSNSYTSKTKQSAQKLLAQFWPNGQFVGGGAAAPAKPDFDWDTFGPSFKALFPNSSWANDPHSAEEAKEKLVNAVTKANQDFPGTDKTQQVNALYQQFFGGGGPTDQDHIDAISQQMEPEVAAKPFKSEELNPEDLQHWAANKPQSPSDWKSFASWWGNTQIPPEAEQGLYNQWFGKNATPEQAQHWFQQVFEHNSTPTNADLGAEGIPGWAHNSWAFGDAAEQEWPAFKAWAAKDPGLGSNLSIGQKIAIWKGLAPDEKAQLVDNYAPASPVDAKAVVNALQQAFPDSDFAKWKQMPQGTLKASVESLAKAGYGPAAQVYNQFFGGDLPIPEEGPEAEEQAPVTQEQPLPPPESLPEWLQPQLQKSNPGVAAKLTKEFMGLAHFADSIGQGDEVMGDTKPNALGKIWNNMPPHLKAQIAGMNNPPWHSLEEFQQWQAAQPTVTQAIKEAAPEQPLSYYPWDEAYDQGNHDAKAKELGKLIDEQKDPETKQRLLGVYHQFYGAGKTTLADSLKGIDPDTDWDKVLQTKTKTQVGNLIKKQLKTEQNPLKFAQLADVWSKHFPHPDKHSSVSPTGIKALNEMFKYNNPGALKSDDLHLLIEYKKKYPNNESDYIGWGGEAGPEAHALAEANQGKTFMPYHGWTPPWTGAATSFKMDPAAYGKSTPKKTYAVPAEEDKSSTQYQGLLDRANNMAPGFLSDKDKAALKSEAFKHWFNKAPVAYRQQMQDHPGSALDAFDDFMSGEDPYPGVQGGAPGKEKFIDVSPFAMVPQRGKGKGKGDIPKAFTHNAPRGDFVKFPRYQDPQETLPLGSGERWAPKYAPLPIYRVLNLDLDHRVSADRAPSHLKSNKERELWAQKQNGRLRRIDEILNGSSAARDPQAELKTLKNWGKSYNLSDQEVQDVANMLFSKQPDLFTDDKWSHIEDFARSKGIDPAEMHDLASKLEVTPPPANKGTYDHPELAGLILDYLEDTAHRSSEGGSASQGGLGWHWTRAINKMYKGVPDAGIGKDEMRATARKIPIAISGLWAGQGEGGSGTPSSGHGGTYDVNHPGEKEHNLHSHAPVHIRRLQIRAPGSENSGYGAWHDTIDPGPYSTWTPGRYEEGNEFSGGGGYAPGDRVDYKPSLAKELDKALGGKHNADDFDTLVPGHQADAVFSKLIHDHPGQKEQLLKLYQEHFIGRPDLPKPHIRRARRDHIPRLATLDERDPRHLYDLAVSWGVPNPERYGLPYLKQLAEDLKGVGFAWKSMAKERGLGIPSPHRGPSGTTVAAIEAAIARLAALEPLPQRYARKSNQRQSSVDFDVRKRAGVLTHQEMRA